MILFTYLRFYYGIKRQGIDRDSFPYIAPFQPWLSFFGFGFLSLVILFNAYTVFLTGNWDVDSFIVGYISLPIFLLFWGGWKASSPPFFFPSLSLVGADFPRAPPLQLYKRSKFVSLDEMDFSTGRRELDDIMDAEEERAVVDNRWWARAWAFVM